MKTVRVRLTEADVAYIRDRYPTDTAPQIAAVLGKPAGTVRQCAWSMRLRKNHAALSAIRKQCGAKRNDRRTDHGR